jgi:CRISPR-associated protein Csm5
MTKPIRYVLRILSPIHVGCDEVYEPMAFTLDEEQCKLIAFDPLEFLKQLPSQERESFSAICRKGTIASIIDIYQFMRRKKPSGFEIPVTIGLVKHYQKTLSLSSRDGKKLEQELNRFSISRTSFNAVSQSPYIPGSSLKGALRTAYLNSKAKEKAFPQKHRGTAAKELEKALLDGGSFDTDPFRMLKVSDFMPFGPVKTRIIYAVNRKKKPSKFEARGPYQILEVIEPGCLFEGWISVLKPEKGADIKRPLTSESIVASSVAFYSAEWKREAAELSSIGAEQPKTQIRQNEYLVRLGRHSGAESVTIERHRDIKIMQKRGDPPKFSSHSTTLWLAAESDKPTTNSGLRPFGWAALKEASEEEMILLEDLRSERASASSAPISTTQDILSLEDEKPRNDVPKETVVVAHEIWEAASISWRPNDQTVVAVLGNRKAEGRGKELIPDFLVEKVLGKKRKAVTARVRVEPVGRDAYRIIKIED